MKAKKESKEWLCLSESYAEGPGVRVSLGLK